LRVADQRLADQIGRDVGDPVAVDPLHHQRRVLKILEQAFGFHRVAGAQGVIDGPGESFAQAPALRPAAGETEVGFVRLREPAQQPLSLGRIVVADRLQDRGEEVLHERHRLLPPRRPQQPQRPRVDIERNVPVGVDIDEVELGLRTAQAELLGDPHSRRPADRREK
jgi:hypothetical protein